MIVKLDELKTVCSKILPAVDTSDLSSFSELLQIEVKNKILTLSVSNREYFVSIKIDTDEVNEFRAVVNALTFLKLVAQTTTEVIQLKIDKQILIFIGNGTYKLPMIFVDEEMATLPTIDMNNVTVSMNIKSGVLKNILFYNTPQLSIGSIENSVQRLYYMDEHGAITFTSGACVTSFELEKPVKILFNQKLCKLFKLFSSDDVAFSLSCEALSDEVNQTKVRFEDNDVTITAILPGDMDLISHVPVSAIRGRVADTYANSVVLNKNELKEAIRRMMIFVNDNLFHYIKFKFNADGVTLSDIAGNNTELLVYEGDKTQVSDYELILDADEISKILDICNEALINVRFGNGQAIVISRGNVSNIIPEIRK